MLRDGFYRYRLLDWEAAKAELWAPMSKMEEGRAAMLAVIVKQESRKPAPRIARTEEGILYF